MLIRKSPIFVLVATVWMASAGFPSWALPLSPGDRIRVLTPLDDELPQDSRFRISGVYEVDQNGTLQIPFLEPRPAAGLEVAQVEKELAEALVKKGFFRPEFLDLSVKVVQWAPVQVTVSGEIFQPGRVLIPAPTESTQTASFQNQAQQEVITGENPAGRYLTNAIRQAGGIKPTAALHTVQLIRGKQVKTFDLSGTFTGQPVPDMPLVAGDRVFVPAVTIPQNELVRPSQLTPSEIPIYLSNLTVPTTPNLGKGGQIVQLEYGTRFSQAVIAAGCAGGARVNAKRKAVLVRTDRLTGQTSVIDRPVEDLLKRTRNENENPFLMPQDGVVCYDSTVTNISKVLSIIGSIIFPFSLIPRLFQE
ncbi:polysaccharide export protein [Kovacikia minuta CCNUW1]|uniref:polysaccharide biosynthesis/export family protein n=1 Tax=Kovacikia minuta TaxID=2931930 RepID=UPI001CCDBFAA|nr:polysaccharide biosynthesis/export family protein [Kovacikia minuta]UBF26814.1 polysaccharide export protein [Kovacikia minuta CCNUW1]